MITRSKAKVLMQPHLQLQASPTGLQRSGTVVKIVPSATGEGIHKRWIYAQEAAEEEQAGIDTGMERSSQTPHETCAQEAASMGRGQFITPAPTLTQVCHGAPRKSTEGRKDRATTPMSPLGKVEGEATQGLHIGESRRQGHGSHFRNPLVPVSLALSPIQLVQSQPIPPCDPSSSGTNVGRRQALGPTGTLLFDEECNPIYMRQALGPSGTLLIVDEGDAIHEQVDGMLAVE